MSLSDPSAHRPWDVVEDLVSRGVTIWASIGAKQARHLPGAILSGNEGKGAHDLVRGGAASWGELLPRGQSTPLTCFPSATAFWRRRPVASWGPEGRSGCSPWMAAASLDPAGRQVWVPNCQFTPPAGRRGHKTPCPYLRAGGGACRAPNHSDLNAAFQWDLEFLGSPTPCLSRQSMQARPGALVRL